MYIPILEESVEEREVEEDGSKDTENIITNDRFEINM